MALASKKQLRDAIFYSKESPELLFNIMFNKVKDSSVPAEVMMSGDTSLTLSDTESVSTRAPVVRVLDQYEDLISIPTVSFAIKTAVTGCTVNSSTGVLTATTSAVAGSKPVIVATSGTVTAELKVLIEEPAES